MTDLDVVIRPHPKLEELIAVLERLRAPGGCAWDRAQTHESLVQYLVEETYELVDAIEAGDDKELVEELGDVLYQVVFHSDIAAEQGRFTLEDVAAHMTAKMVGRHPHVFGDLVAETPDAVMLHWDRLKAEEKPARASVLDGIPQAMPALALADKLLGRAAKVGRRARAGGRGGQRGRARRAAAQHRRRGPGCGARQRARAAGRPARAAARDPRRGGGVGLAGLDTREWDRGVSGQSPARHARLPPRREAAARARARRHPRQLSGARFRRDRDPGHGRQRPPARGTRRRQREARLRSSQARPHPRGARRRRGAARPRRPRAALRPDRAARPVLRQPPGRAADGVPRDPDRAGLARRAPAEGPLPPVHAGRHRHHRRARHPGRGRAARGDPRDRRRPRAGRRQHPDQRPSPAHRHARRPSASRPTSTTACSSRSTSSTRSASTG